MLFELSDSIVVLSACISPGISGAAQIFHFISLIGLIGLLATIPFRQQIVDAIEGGTERKLRTVRALNIAERVLVIAIALTLALWFISPLFLPESFSSCLAPF